MADVTLPFTLTNGTSADASQVQANLEALRTALNDLDAANLGAAFLDVLAPAGRVQAFARPDTPSGWLACDGSAVSRATYPKLFTAIGTTYGAGDGSTTFNLPDYRGRVLAGLGTHADVDALTDNDGLAVGSRRPKHKHTGTTDAHTETKNSNSGGPMNALNLNAGGAVAGKLAGAGTTVFESVPEVRPVSHAVNVGPQTGSEPVDSAAYHAVRLLISTGF